MSKTPITTPEDAVCWVGEELCQMNRKMLGIINLKQAMPCDFNFASVGTLNQSLCHPRELFKTSILSNEQI